MTAPVASGRSRMAAIFPIKERGATESLVINGVPTRGSEIAPVKSDMALKVVDNRVFDNISAQGSNVSKGLNDVPLKSDMFTQTVSNLVNSPVFDTVTSQNVVSIQSTPLYVSSNPYSYVYVNSNDVTAPSQANLGHYDRQEFVSTSRRPTVLPDSSLDDDSEVDYRPGEKPSNVAKTPSRPKSYKQSCLKIII